MSYSYRVVLEVDLTDEEIAVIQHRGKCSSCPAKHCGLTGREPWGPFDREVCRVVREKLVQAAQQWSPRAEREAQERSAVPPNSCANHIRRGCGSCFWWSALSELGTDLLGQCRNRDQGGTAGHVILQHHAVCPDWRQGWYRPELRVNP